jgi:hypothetical protein
MMSSALESFIAGNKELNEAEFLNLSTNNNHYDLDPALRQAIAGHAALVVHLPQIKRRQRETAAFEAGRHLEGGYGLARYALGTHGTPFRYSTAVTVDQITGDLSNACESYDFDSVTGALHPDAHELMLGSSQISAKKSVLGSARVHSGAGALLVSESLRDSACIG